MRVDAARWPLRPNQSMSDARSLSSTQGQLKQIFT